MCDELWMEVRDIVQETGIKTIPKKKKCKKPKCLSEEVLQIAMKRRDAKGKGKRKDEMSEQSTNGVSNWVPVSWGRRGLG